MVAQRQELQTFSFAPRNLQEAQEYALIIANSGICPQALKGRPNDVLVILQLGHELGLKPMQALRSLGCINGVPFAWGDGQLALVKNHPSFVDIKEWMEGDIKDQTLTAYCTITRKNQEPQTRSFDIEDAKRAGLWMQEKKPVWKMYPKRMLQHRARTFACRDVFADALFGLMTHEEVIEISEEKVQPIRPKNKGMSGLEESLGIHEDISDAELITDDQITEKLVDEFRDENLGEAPNILIDELLSLIKEKNIPEKSLQKWCAQFNVTIVQDIPTQAIQTIINHIKEKM